MRAELWNKIRAVLVDWEVGSYWTVENMMNDIAKVIDEYEKER